MPSVFSCSIPPRTYKLFRAGLICFGVGVFTLLPLLPAVLLFFFCINGRRAVVGHPYRVPSILLIGLSIGIAYAVYQVLSIIVQNAIV